MAKQAVEAVGSLGEVADQLGVTTDTLQTFRYAATQVGVSQDEWMPRSKLTKTIGWPRPATRPQSIPSTVRHQGFGRAGQGPADRRRDPRHR
jgi:hypothetical protein